MSESERQFRSVAFGGFHKQDVLNYIESAVKEQSAKVEALQKELAEGKTAYAALATEKEALTAGAEERSAKLEETSAALLKATADLEQKTEQVAALEKEAARQKARLKEIEPAAQAYEAIKERTAGIELEAHHRAQAAEAVALEHIKAAESELEQWMTKVHSGYDRLRTDMDATISHASSELIRVEKSLGSIIAGFAEHDAELEALLRTCSTTGGPKAPLPLPLDGE